MRNFLLSKTICIILLCIFNFSCSSEESVIATNKVTQNENHENFRKALKEYVKTRTGEFVCKGSVEANSKMAEVAFKFLLSIGFDKESIDEKSKYGDEAIISLAIIEYAKFNNLN